MSVPKTQCLLCNIELADLLDSTYYLSDNRTVQVLAKMAEAKFCQSDGPGLACGGPVL